MVYPPTYPEVTPELEVEVGEKWSARSARAESGEASDDDDNYDDDDDNEEEDDEDEDAPVNNFDYPPALLELTASDALELQLQAASEAAENLGLPSVFAVVGQLKDDAEAAVHRKMDAVDAARDRDRLAQEAEERKKFEGTEVTKESFAAWRATFRAEQGIDALLNKYVILDKNGQPKLTGRQMFERGLIDGSEEDDADPETEDLTDTVKKLAV